MPSLVSYVWLSLKRGLGPYLSAELLRVMGSPEAVYAADDKLLAQACPRLRRQHLDLLRDKSTDEAEYVIEQCARKDIRILPISDSAYPNRLRSIEDPPVVLYIRGRWPDLDTMPGISVVGTRSATSYGVQIADSIGATLARAGFVTVSGMALGNDSAAHRGALRAGGLTVAVLAGGPDVCYPPRNLGLMGDIMLSGAVVSEYPPGTPPHAGNFPARNRIISGMTPGTLLVEGAKGSGAMITVNFALDQGRDVFAVPGSIYSPLSAMPNQLIVDGAKPVISAWEILDFYRWAEKPAPNPVPRREIELDDTEKRIVLPLTEQELSFEELLQETQISPAKLNSHLTMLELRGIIVKAPGGMYRAYLDSPVTE